LGKNVFETVSLAPMFGMYDLIFYTAHFKDFECFKMFSEIVLGEEMEDLARLDLEGMVFNTLTLPIVRIVFRDNGEKE
jgi:hypothetical protein